MDKAADDLKRTLIYQGEASAVEMQQDLASLRELDKQSERKRRNAWLVCVFGLVATVGGGILLAQEAGRVFPSCLLLVGGLMLVGGLIAAVVAGKADIPDRRYELLYGVLGLLRHDMASDAPLRVRLDFKSHTQKGKFERNGKIGPWDVKFYQDPWLMLDGRLLDGTHFHLQVSELTQLRSRWKRSVSGKQKHKSKTKSATVASLNLKVKPHKYPQLESTQGKAVECVRLPEWCTLKRVAVEVPTVALKVGSKTQWDVAGPNRSLAVEAPDGVAMVALMFLSLYEILQQAK